MYYVAFNNNCIIGEVIDGHLSVYCNVETPNIYNTSGVYQESTEDGWNFTSEMVTMMQNEGYAIDERVNTINKGILNIDLTDYRQII